MVAQKILRKISKICLICCQIGMLILFFTACNGDHKISSEDSISGIKRIKLYQKMEVTARYANSLRGRIYSIPVLVLRGSYEEMGEAHGALLGKEILHLLDKVLIPYVNHIQKGAWDKKLIPAVKAYVFPARYEKELEGIMRGIKAQCPNKYDRMLFSINREISINDLRVLNCFNELGYWVKWCSSFAAWGRLTRNGTVISARNLDELSIPGKIPFVIFARQPTEQGRKASIEIFIPGVIGVSTAMNETGFMVIANHERGLYPASSRPWVPRAIVLRDVVESAQAGDSVNKIAHFFQHRHVALGSSTLIVFPARDDKNRLLPFVLEWDGNPSEDGTTVRREDPSIINDAIVSTNHYIKRRLGNSEISADSQERFDIIVDWLRKFTASKKVIDIQKAIKIMSSVARSGRTITYLTVISIPREKKMIFAVYPRTGVAATRGEWIEITWDQIFGKS